MSTWMDMQNGGQQPGLQCTCQNAYVERDGGMRLPTGPQMPGTGDPRPAVGRGWTIGRHLSALSSFL